jgi:hypothetical protein
LKFSLNFRVQQLSLIEKKFEKCKELSDEKVLLANQTYEMVIFFNQKRLIKRVSLNRLINISAV